MKWTIIPTLTLATFLSTSVYAESMRPKYPGNDAGSFTNPYIVTDDDGHEYEAKSKYPELQGSHSAGTFVNPLILNTPSGRHELTERYPDLHPGDGLGEAGSAANPFRMDGRTLDPVE